MHLPSRFDEPTFIERRKTLEMFLKSAKIPYFFLNSCFSCHVSYHNFISTHHMLNLRRDMIDSLPLPLFYTLAHHPDSNRLKLLCKDSIGCKYNDDVRYSTWALIQKRLRFLQLDSAIKTLYTINVNNFIDHQKIDKEVYYLSELYPSECHNYNVLKFIADGSYRNYYISDSLTPEAIHRSTYTVGRYSMDMKGKYLVLESFSLSYRIDSFRYVYTMNHRYDYLKISKHTMCLKKVMVNGAAVKFPKYVYTQTR